MLVPHSQPSVPTLVHCRRALKAARKRYSGAGAQGKRQLVTTGLVHMQSASSVSTGASSRVRLVKRSTGLSVGLVAVVVAILGSPAGSVSAADRENAAVQMAGVTVALPGSQAALPITITPTTAAPPKSYIRIRGLPSTVTLTEGHNIAAGVWAVPLISLPNLAVRIPDGLSGKADIRASLVSIDGEVLSEAHTSLVIGSTALLSGPSAAGDATASASGPDSGGGPHGTDAAAGTPPKGSFLSSFPPQTAPATAHAPAATLPHAPKHAIAPPPRDGALPPSANQARALLARGIARLNERDIAGARRFLERAADLGLGEAALRLASTYDPNEMGRHRTPDLPPDVNLARKWYERAKSLGVREAGSRLERLTGR